MTLENKTPAELIAELTTAHRQLAEYQTTIQVLQRRCQQLATQVTTQTATVTALTGRLQAEIEERKRFASALMTSLKQIERAKQEWEITVDSLPELVCLLDQEGRIIRANRTLERWQLGEVVTIHGSFIHQVFQSEWLQDWSRLREILKEGQSIDTEVVDKGLNRQLYVRLQPILPYTNWHNQATASFAAVIVRDITKRKQFEELLQRRNRELSMLYDQLRQEAETKATLLQEVNHRVKNNLSAIVGLMYAEQHQVVQENQSLYLPIMKDLITRVQALATVHTLLSASEWQPLFLSELSEQIIHSTLRANVSDKAISVNVTPSSIRVNSDQAHNLALIINELTMNTLKQIQPQQKNLDIQVSITSDDDVVNFNYQDNITNIFGDQEIFSQTSLYVGFRIIQQIIRKNLHGKFFYYVDDERITTIQFKLVVNEEQNSEHNQ